MLTEDQNAKIDELTKLYAPLMSVFPRFDPEQARTPFFPDKNDLRAIAEKVEPTAFTMPRSDELKSPKLLVKYLFVRLVQPILKKLMKRQMLFNEYTWLLANTVSAQAIKIQELEKRLDDIQAKNKN